MNIVSFCQFIPKNDGLQNSLLSAVSSKDRIRNFEQKQLVAGLALVFLPVFTANTGRTIAGTCGRIVPFWKRLRLRALRSQPIGPRVQPVKVRLREIDCLPA